MDRTDKNGAVSSGRPDQGRSLTLSIRKLCLRSELGIGILSLAPRRSRPGTIRRVNDSLGLARVERQGKADRLENTADISGHQRGTMKCLPSCSISMS
jgi:hypothetical protein